MSENYIIPKQTRIGHVHLRVADLNRAHEFYRDLLGFEVTMRYGNQAAFISAGGYHHHIGLNTWHSKGSPPASKEGVGLFHTAILYPTRKKSTEQIDYNFIVTVLGKHYMLFPIRKKIVVNEKEFFSGYYLAVEPEAASIAGVLVLLAGFGQRAEQ